jgi:hypothetical protein
MMSAIGVTLISEVTPLMLPNFLLEVATAD